MFERVLAARMNGNEGPHPHRNAESSGRELLRAVDTLWDAHAHALTISARTMRPTLRYIALCPGRGLTLARAHAREHGAHTHQQRERRVHPGFRRSVGNRRQPCGHRLQQPPPSPETTPEVVGCPPLAAGCHRWTRVLLHAAVGIPRSVAHGCCAAHHSNWLPSAQFVPQALKFRQPFGSRWRGQVGWTMLLLCAAGGVLCVVHD